MNSMHFLLVLPVILAASSPSDLETELRPFSPDDNDKVTICHKPDGPRETITVSENAVPAHIKHGDFIGPCSDSCVMRMEFPSHKWKDFKGKKDKQTEFCDQVVMDCYASLDFDIAFVVLQAVAIHEGSNGCVVVEIEVRPIDHACPAPSAVYASFEAQIYVESSAFAQGSATSQCSSIEDISDGYWSSSSSSSQSYSGWFYACAAAGGGVMSGGAVFCVTRKRRPYHSARTEDAMSLPSETLAPQAAV